MVRALRRRPTTTRKIQIRATDGFWSLCICRGYVTNGLSGKLSRVGSYGTAKFTETK